jgi:hypothetical protein
MDGAGKSSRGARSRGARGSGLLKRLHWALLALVATLCVYLTVDELFGPAPSCGDWICLDLGGVIPGIAWAFLVVFGVTSTYVSYAERLRRLRGVAYALAVAVSIALAVPGGFVLGGAAGDAIKRFQVEHWNARLRASVALRRWSYATDAAGKIGVTAEITAGTNGHFSLRVQPDTAPSTGRCDDPKTVGLELAKGQQATLTWQLVCPSGAVPRIQSLTFAVFAGLRDPIRYVTFSRSSSAPEGNGNSLTLPLPPPVGGN